jgi:hypothetical protein
MRILSAVAREAVVSRLARPATTRSGQLQDRQGFSLKYQPVCGRYRLSHRKQLLAEYFGADFSNMDWEPRYNIAPTRTVPVVRLEREDATLRACVMRWGLIPSWAADPTIGARTINSRSETAASRPSFREPLQRRRCLIPADAFYEWKRLGKAKQRTENGNFGSPVRTFLSLSCQGQRAPLARGCIHGHPSRQQQCAAHRRMRS